MLIMFPHKTNFKLQSHLLEEWPGGKDTYFRWVLLEKAEEKPEAIGSQLLHLAVKGKRKGNLTYNTEQSRPDQDQYTKIYKNLDQIIPEKVKD